MWLSNWTTTFTVLPILNRYQALSNKLPSITSKASIKCKTLSLTGLFVLSHSKSFKNSSNASLPLRAKSGDQLAHRKCIPTAICKKLSLESKGNQNLLMDKVGANLLPCSCFFLFGSATLCSKFWTRQRKLHGVGLVTSGYLPFDSGATQWAFLPWSPGSGTSSLPSHPLPSSPATRADLPQGAGLASFPWMGRWGTGNQKSHWNIPGP